MEKNSTAKISAAKISTDCVIAGGGPAGMMLGYLLARQGVRVTVIEKGPRLTSREDEDVSAAGAQLDIARFLADLGEDSRAVIEYLKTL